MLFGRPFHSQPIVGPLHSKPNSVYCAPKPPSCAISQLLITVHPPPTAPPPPAHLLLHSGSIDYSPNPDLSAASQFLRLLRGSYDTTGSVQRTLGLGTAGGRCGADWGPRSKLKQEGSLPIIFEFRNHLPEPLLPALIRCHPLYTHPPARTR
ncbi:hypothetical protein TIFTF001_028587 [Ficus carica]|uniref:Uncharacterized protein n=1 Tax=Ficus carica TaxID=3494 RepID=A0AA88J1P9_FICCA|nr:hypothetical protein TIFTF001_028587 [Ficus carica]